MLQTALSLVAVKITSCLSLQALPRLISHFLWRYRFTISDLHPFEIYDEERIQHLYQTIRHLVAFHVEHGYHDFVINYVFETPESLARLRRLLSDLDDVIYAFRLVAADEDIAARIRARGGDEADTAWHLARYKELVAIQETSAQRGDMGFVVDTTGQSAHEVAATIWQNIHEAVEIVPYDPNWPALYASEENSIRAALGNLAVGIYHIGSTAVPGLDAKPVIDILVTVRELEDFKACIAPLQTLGYAFIDYAQNIDRKFFRKGLPRTHHLHIVKEGSPSMTEHLAFRDALRADHELRQRYAELKASLSTHYKTDRAAYSAAKTNFVQSVLAAKNRRPA